MRERLEGGGALRDDEEFMRRALELAERGRWTVSPNPMVGCVVVRDGQLVGEGHHEHPGGPHAEVVALDRAGADARGATAYVTLEPCDHVGRTGPCTTALIDAGVARVVAAVSDPNPASGDGAGRLRAAGIDVETGVCEDEARRQNTVYFHGIATGRPYVTLKAAVSLDGRIAAADGSSRWLTGHQARDRGHALRAEADAIVVGSGTVLADDPHLTVRLPGYSGPPPLRVVLDRRGRVTAGRRVLDDAAPTLVLSDTEPAGVLKHLWERGVAGLLIEGGGQVAGAFLREGLVDRLVVHLAPVLLGEQAVPAVGGPWPAALAAAPRLRLDAVEQLGDDLVLTYVPGRE